MEADRGAFAVPADGDHAEGEFAVPLDELAQFELELQLRPSTLQANCSPTPRRRASYSSCRSSSMAAARPIVDMLARPRIEKNSWSPLRYSAPGTAPTPSWTIGRSVTEGGGNLVPPREKRPTEQRERIGAAAVEAVRDAMWKAADALRGPVDVAEHKEFVLGLLFVRYLSDSFEERRAELAEELAAEGVPEERRSALLEDRDAYLERGVFWIPEAARWSRITADIRHPHAGDRLSFAMEAIMRENETLSGVLPPVLHRGDIGRRRLAELVDLIGDPRFTHSGRMTAQDTLSEVYAYFLAYFARAEGKRGGEFHTPQPLAQLIVEILEPYRGRLYDPACGSGGMLVEAAKFADTHAALERPGFLTVYGQEVNERTWRLARMNLAIHGVDTGDLGAGPPTPSATTSTRTSRPTS